MKKITVEPRVPRHLKFFDTFKRSFYITILFGCNYLPKAHELPKYVRILVKIYSIFISVTTSLIVLSSTKHVISSPYLFIALEYIITVSVLCFSKKDYREQFYNNLAEIDEKLNVYYINYYTHLKKLAYYIVLYAVVTRLTFSVALCFSFKESCAQSPQMLFASNFTLIAVDISQVPRIVVFSFVRYRIAALRLGIKKNFRSRASVAFLNVKSKYYNIMIYHEIYKKIIDTVDYISNFLNPFFLLSLMCCFPKIMLMLYHILCLHQDGAPIMHIVVLGLQAVHWGVMPCLPGIFAEMTSAEVDKMKLYLLDKYRKCTDEVERAGIKEFLDYVQIRPYDYRIWRLIPVNITLPVGLLSLCTTYLIVIVQFTHIFE